jgi:hypothetical protein
MSTQPPTPPHEPASQLTQGQYPTPEQPGTSYQGGLPGPKPAGSGLAVAALVLGILGLLSFWVPVVNVVAILMAVVGIVLGVLAVRGVKRGTQAGKGMAIAGIVLSALTVVGAIVVNVATVALFSSVDDAIQQAEQESQDRAAGRGVAADEADQEAAADAEVLALGKSAEVGDYTVTVTSVTQDADDLVAAANEFNEAPQHQYVVVDLSVVYNGTEEGTPFMDLMATIDGADARQYDESTCMAILPKDGTDVPTLTQGGTADYQVCMDAPTEALDGATVFVEPTISFDEERVYWTLQ